jgi:hypothetical protein
MPVAPDLVGSALEGRYELHALIGEGAFGRVYRGLDRRLARSVAVKVIKPWWAEDGAWVERFEHEARLLARVSDPGIVQIFDIGHAEEGPYYVAELVDGESLAERLPRGELPLSEALGVAEQLCSALASAHAQGIVHCDVKPANVLIRRDGKVKVGDFGVARLAGGTSQADSATVAGTPRYMSPEQARGRASTPATDVYSAGVVLYEMLAGAPPFVEGSAVELGLRHVQEQPRRLPERVPAGVRALVEKAMRKDPGGRYGDGAEMAAALRAAAAELPKRPRLYRGGTQAVADAPTKALISPRTRRMPKAPASGARRAGGEGPPGSSPTEFALMGDHGGGPGRRRALAVAGTLAVLVAVVLVLVVLRGGVGASARRVQVPAVVGQSAASAERAIARAGLRSDVKLVAAPGSTAGLVTRQSPLPGVGARHGSRVALSIAEAPRWRTLTTFSGIDDGRSVPVGIEGRRWRVSYSMSYVGSCTLVLVCFGPSAAASNVRTGASFEGFDLSSGSGHGHTFDSGPGLYRIDVSGGQDSARWTMTIQDYY